MKPAREFSEPVSGVGPVGPGWSRSLLDKGPKSLQLDYSKMLGLGRPGLLVISRGKVNPRASQLSSKTHPGRKVDGVGSSKTMFPNKPGRQFYLLFAYRHEAEVAQVLLEKRKKRFASPLVGSQLPDYSADRLWPQER